MTWRRIIVIAACVITCAILAIAIPVIHFEVVQRRNMDSAAQHAPIVLRALKGDPRFSRVAATPFTAKNGCLLVSAMVEPGSLDDLKRIVARTNPPVSVLYDVLEIRAATRPAR